MKMIISAVITALLLVNSFSSLAQFKQIAESPVFEEPVAGYAKMLQMKNGNTAYIHVTAREGIELRIYDANHIEKVVGEVDINTDRVKNSHETTFFPTNPREEIDGIFEMGDDIVVFINEFTHKKSILYRIIIDGNTAKLKEEKEILSEPWATYTIKKDTYSDNYAIMMNERIIHYNAEHKEINTAEFKSPDAANPTLYYRDMIVLGNDRICLFYLATDKAKDYKGNIYMVTMEAVSAKISYDKLDLPADLRYDNVIVKFDPIDKKIFFLTVAKSNEEGYETYINIIDPVLKQVVKLDHFGPDEAVNQAYAERFDKKKGYGGLPQNLFINQDGSISVVYEEMLVQRSSTVGQQTYSRTDTKLGKLLISTFDKKGKSISNYMAPKAHWVIFTVLGLFYHYRQETDIQEMWRGNQYKPFQYIDGPKGKFIFFNDTERNNDVTKDKFTEVQGVTDCDAFMYKLTGSDLFPKREYAFGQPAKGHSIALYSVSAYDKKTNTYVTLKLDDTRKKKIKMVWLQPE